MLVICISKDSRTVKECLFYLKVLEMFYICSSTFKKKTFPYIYKILKRSSLVIVHILEHCKSRNTAIQEYRSWNTANEQFQNSSRTVL